MGKQDKLLAYAVQAVLYRVITQSQRKLGGNQ